MSTNDKLPYPMANKTPEMRNVIEDLFPGTTKAIKDLKCPMCKKPITGFKDGMSEREYGISGLCQNCQDEMFK